MENIGEWEQKNLKNELLRGKELAKQLQLYLNVQPSSSMPASPSEDGELLVQKILSSYEKALSFFSSTGIQISESPSSPNGSPRSEDSDREFKDQDQRINASRKRNSLPTWTQKFQVSPGMAPEGSLDDGFCWRKYGQKDILGAKHPRGYYRCTHKNLQGCLATKQVQRSDDDPTVFEITYRGNHTCSQVTNLSPPSAAPEFQQPNSSNIDPNLVQKQSHSVPDQNQQSSPDALLNSWASLRVITENLDTHEPTLFPAFSYDPTSSYKAADHVESASMTVGVNFAEFPPSFLSPTTSCSGLSYFSASSGGLSEGFVGNQKLQANKSELSFPSPTSALNSQTLGSEFPFGEVEMEPSFTFDHTNFFS
ncbi:probable WRKY transcription factor 53 isoform X2 [Momordica charantia]|uniref:Probable WRKY transcription factor 53 isoform X2 n=1 Tax=Momordica charantia TaxID=3673 RepID=A0A6J1CH11_MOMCH|nr:probable WRKY transcription factor 53 isoform X2 [Momordica charantia]